MKKLLVRFALLSALLVLGGAVPTGTTWLTPLASLGLLALAYLGKAAPAAEWAALSRDWPQLRRLLWARRRAGFGNLLLLGLPLWLQVGVATVGGRDAAVALATAPLPATARHQLPRTLVRVWFEPDTVAATLDTPGWLRVRGAGTPLDLRAQGNDGPLGSSFPPATTAWAWADLDLLPDFVITVNSPQQQLLFVPASGAHLQRQSAAAAACWQGFLLAYPAVGLATLLWVLGRALLVATGVVRRNSSSIHR